jgi:Tetratricopeptide repeat
LADVKRVLGADHPDTLTARNNLANAYQDAGRTAEAITLCEQNLADVKRVLGADHPHTLAARDNLAVAYRAAGRTSCGPQVVPTVGHFRVTAGGPIVVALPGE